MAHMVPWFGQPVPRKQLQQISEQRYPGLSKWLPIDCRTAVQRKTQSALDHCKLWQETRCRNTRRHVRSFRICWISCKALGWWSSRSVEAVRSGQGGVWEYRQELKVHHSKILGFLQDSKGQRPLRSPHQRKVSVVSVKLEPIRMLPINGQTHLHLEYTKAIHRRRCRTYRTRRTLRALSVGPLRT